MEYDYDEFFSRFGIEVPQEPKVLGVHADVGHRDFFITTTHTRRTFCATEEDAIDHARDYIDQGKCDEYLVVKVVGRVRRERVPVTYERFED